MSGARNRAVAIVLIPGFPHFNFAVLLKIPPKWTTGVNILHLPLKFTAKKAPNINTSELPRTIIKPNHHHSTNHTSIKLYLAANKINNPLKKIKELNFSRCIFFEYLLFSKQNSNLIQIIVTQLSKFIYVKKQKKTKF